MIYREVTSKISVLAGSLFLASILSACGNPSSEIDSPEAQSRPQGSLSKDEIKLLDELTAGNAIYQPVITLKDRRKITSGKAFCAQVPLEKKIDESESLVHSGKKVASKHVVVSALRLFGPEGGLEQQIPGSQVRDQVGNVELKGLASGRVMGETMEVMTKRGRPFDPSKGEDATGDLVLLKAPDNLSENAILVDDAPAKVGLQVYLCARSADGTVKLYPGNVTASSAQILKVKLSKPEALQGLAGSPLVTAGKVVCGMVVSYTPETGEMMCVPSGFIRETALSLN